MELYIQVEGGEPVNHPAFSHNLVEVFGHVPSNWEPFVRQEKPSPPLYKVVEEEPTYEKVDGVWTDVWSIRDMTPEEKKKIQQSMFDFWTNRPDAFNFTAWIYDEENNKFNPPIPRPTETTPDGFMYRWCGAIDNWKLAPVPTENTIYFDFDKWENVEFSK